MAGLIGKKIGMTSVFLESGLNIPCTVIQAGPCTVTQIKNKAKDGYDAVQLGFGDKKDKHSNKPEMGHFKKSKTKPKRKIAEFQFDKELNLGDEVKVEDIFQTADFIKISGISKGKGFQGVMKRHGFRGTNDATHGQHKTPRAPGAIGMSSDPSRVFKGMRMAGQTGNKKITVSNIEVIKVNNENNLLLVKGGVPGPKGSYLIIEK